MNEPVDRAELETALRHIPADDREMWVNMAMCVKSGLGDSGFALWDAWSRTSESYNQASARSVWRSVKASGKMGVATLFYLAQQWGYTPRAKPKPRKDRLEMAEWQKNLEAERRTDAEKQRNLQAHASDRAKKMLAKATIDVHPYLTNKGFPEYKISVLDGNILVPMRPFTNYFQLSSLQIIKPDGEKRFLKHGKAQGSVYLIGRSPERWWCEGLATGLSIKMALQEIYAYVQVIVAFSAHNLASLANAGYIVADRDPWMCQDCKFKWRDHKSQCPSCAGKRFIEPTGEKYAKRTGLPYWVPPMYGDANDFHQKYGIRALAQELNTMRETQNPFKSRR